MGRVRNETKVVLLTRGTKGDLYPFIAMGKCLANMVGNVYLLSNYLFEEDAKAAGLLFVPIDDKEQYEVFNNMPQYYRHMPSLLDLYKSYSVQSIERELALIRECLGEGGSGIIVANSNHFLAPLMAKELYGIPLFICILSPSYEHSFVLIEAFLINLSEEVNGVRRKLGLPTVSNWKSWLMQFDRCFALWPTWYKDGAKKSQQLEMSHLGFLPLEGAVNSPLTEETKQFLNQSGKTVLITHGTSKPFNDNYFRLTLEACACSGCKVLVTTKFVELLPCDIPHNVLWVEYCSFTELLPKIDVVIHHGGIGTASECIAHSVPQIIIGQGYDRQHNGKTIESLNLGYWLSPRTLTVEQVQEKVKRLLSGDGVGKNSFMHYQQLHDESAVRDFYQSVARIDIAKPDAPRKIISDGVTQVDLPLPVDESTLDDQVSVGSSDTSPLTKIEQANQNSRRLLFSRLIGQRR